MCAAGPPNAVTPRRKKRSATSASEPRGSFSGKNDAAGNVWYVRSPAELYGTSFADGTAKGPDPRLFYIDQTPPAPEGGLPMPLAGRIELLNRHFEYALTWFALSVTLLVIFLVYAKGAMRTNA